MTFKRFLSGRGPVALSLLGWFYYFLILLTFYNYITILTLSCLTITAPTLLLTFRKKSRAHFKRIFRRRILITGIMLGLIALAFFPNLLRIPSQVHRRFDRTNTLITPDDKVVQNFKDKFLESQGGLDNWTALALQERLDIFSDYVKEHVVWTEDIVTRQMAGDASTPRETILLGKDDCRGQAVVTVSVLISLGYDAWVVERPWHWYTMVFDDDGKAYKVNPGDSYFYESLMRWNEEKIILLKNPIEMYFITLSTPNYFYQYYNMLSYGVFVLGIIAGIGAALYSTVCLGEFGKLLSRESEAVSKFKKRMTIGVSLSLTIMVILFLLSFSPLELLGFYIFIYGITAIFTILTLEIV